MAHLQRRAVEQVVRRFRRRSPRRASGSHGTEVEGELFEPSGSRGAKESEPFCKRMPPKPATSAVQVPASEAM